MANHVVYDIKDYDQMTVEDAIEVAEFVGALNYLADEGFIEIEEGENGEPLCYPVPVR